MEQHKPKKAWITPQVTRYGSVKEITLQIKNKTIGGGDDVMVDNQAILADLAS